jgi:uncharacterized protein YcnI
MKLQNFKFEIRNMIGLAVVLMIFLSSATLTLAHVSVKPNQVNVGAFQTFTTGVPNEKDIPTVGLRLVIPENLEHVTPNVKPGWVISVKKSGEGEEAKVTEISWTGGSIPAGQRDDFLFSAKAPDAAGNIDWKAYQTYQDGTVVAWDQDPNAPKAAADHDSQEMSSTPYSVTRVVNDLTASSSPVVIQSEKNSNTNVLIFSVSALLLSFAAIGLAMRKK